MEKGKAFFEAKIAQNPSLFICLGLSGAGLTTAVNQVVKDGLAEPAPPQFVTRPLRSNEQRGDQYYSVTEDVLTKIPQQIALQSTFYDNQYGFFRPAIKRIERILESGRNVIVDSGNPPQNWQNIIKNRFPITSLFFAPQSPQICADRILERAKQLRNSLSAEELGLRVKDNAQNISKIYQYDYWIDTTNFDNIFPSVESIVIAQSFKPGQNFKLRKVKEKTVEISSLIEAFSVVQEIAP